MSSDALVAGGDEPRFLSGGAFRSSGCAFRERADVAAQTDCLPDFVRSVAFICGWEVGISRSFVVFVPSRGDV
ncbi:MAG: hypothetical protein ACFNP8_04730, partial [Alloprevotella sp.]